MYTINKSNGIGQVISEDANTYTVFFEETGKTSKLIKDFTKVYATAEEAQAILEEREIAEEAGREERNLEDAKIISAGVAASAWLSNTNRENAKKMYFIK